MQREYDESGYEPPARTAREIARQFVVVGSVTGFRAVATIHPGPLVGPALDVPTEHR